MSDQQIGKKEMELIDLHPFLEAYEYATGERLSLLGAAECPDFVCSRPNGEKIGIELTQIMRNPKMAFAYRIFGREEMEPFEAVELISHQLDAKEEKRQKNYGILSDKTILVFQLNDCPLSSLKNFIEALQDDFINHGFVELWLADYTDDAFHDIHLFCLFPSKIWGYYERPYIYGSKPYG
jgi:hypothetical protein